MSKQEILNCQLDTANILLILNQYHKFDETTGKVHSRTLPTEENIRTILMQDARLVDSITYCTFSDRVLYFGEELTRQDVHDLRFFSQYTAPMITVAVAAAASPAMSAQLLEVSSGIAGDAEQLSERVSPIGDDSKCCHRGHRMALAVMLR